MKQQNVGFVALTFSSYQLQTCLQFFVFHAVFFKPCVNKFVQTSRRLSIFSSSWEFFLLYLTGRISPFFVQADHPCQYPWVQPPVAFVGGHCRRYDRLCRQSYDSKENRQHLEDHQLLDGIMRKARRNRPLTEAQHELTELLHRWYTVFFELTESG